jgi:uncharacterized protein YqfB (UPF0267 family)
MPQGVTISQVNRHPRFSGGNLRKMYLSPDDTISFAIFLKKRQIIQHLQLVYTFLEVQRVSKLKIFHLICVLSVKIQKLCFSVNVVVNPIKARDENVTLELLDSQIQEINFILDEFFLITLGIFISCEYHLFDNILSTK